MIEVEKKIQPTEEQKEKLLGGAVLISQKKVLDNYYDTLDFELTKKNVYLRNRDGSWELKRYLDSSKRTGIAEEITDEKEILSILGVSNFKNVDDFNEKKLKLLASIITERIKYKKDGFVIDHDKTDFDLELFEIELIVEKESQIIEAENKILEYISKFGILESKLDIKPVEYLKKVRPEIYKSIKLE